MFLKKVEISGFKSFAHKTALEFLPACVFNAGSKKSCGITAIVGPNGSGKSNVADAIRWVMGEQSMKNLRGKKSEDVIFAGSGAKSRLGSAIATLHFDNSDKRIPLEFSEVAISRKLFRSGESDYLINGSRVRLIDVIDLLAKAGVGKESYCVINQGMSDAILAATQSERRMILEDAAGVKQYQIKKERAIRKLDSTKNNLQRVGDLVKEISPHLRMLKRQADKALKGKEIAATLREKQIRLFSYRWHIFQKEKENFSQEKNELGAKMMNVQREVDKINDEINRQSKEVQNLGELEKLEKKREELVKALSNLEKELIINEGRLEIEKEKIAQEEIIESLPVDLKYVKERLERIRESQEKLIARLEKAEKISELQDLKEFARAIQQELFDLYQDVGKGKVEVAKKTSAQFEASKEKTKSLLEDQRKLREDIAKAKSEVELVEKEIGGQMEKNRQLRQKFFDLESRSRTKQDELGKLKDQYNEAKIKLAKVEVREEDLIREIENEFPPEADSPLAKKINPRELKYDGSEVDVDHLDEEIYRLKMQMEQVGGIDPLVTEEYEETKKRHEFLTKESEDLEKAMKSLKEVIKEMDERIDEVFNEAYEQINKEFTKYFRIMFGGGNAHLIKLKISARGGSAFGGKNQNQEEAEDVNGDNLSEKEETEEQKEEIGIDIFACPPGKRIHNINMLSGGEKSLTSIALLFAIISYNPPPFAVLDEVDAALDEANSGRFGRILQELSGNTQFVVITHNRETMRQASLLYGVTMGADGISKLLSVRLDQVGTGGEIVKS